MEIKARLKNKSINDVASMSLYSTCKLTPNYYLITLLCSKLFCFYLKAFINNTVNLQINDFRLFPIIIPNQKQLKQAENLFYTGKSIREQRTNNLIDEKKEKDELKKLQKEVDEFVCQLYGIEFAE